MEVSFTVESTNGKQWVATCKDPVMECAGNDLMAVCRGMEKKIENWFTDTFGTSRKVVVNVPVIKAKVKASVEVRPESTLDEFEPKETEEVVAAVKTPADKVLKACSNCGMDVLCDTDEESPLCDACSYDETVNAKNGEHVDTATSPLPPVPPLPRPPAPKVTNHAVNGPCQYISDGKGVVAVGKCEAASNEPSDTPGIKTDSDGCCSADYEHCAYYKPAGVRTTSLDPQAVMNDLDDGDMPFFDGEPMGGEDSYE